MGDYGEPTSIGLMIISPAGPQRGRQFFCVHYEQTAPAALTIGVRNIGEISHRIMDCLAIGTDERCSPFFSRKVCHKNCELHPRLAFHRRRRTGAEVAQRAG